MVVMPEGCHFHPIISRTWFLIAMLLAMAGESQAQTSQQPAGVVQAGSSVAEVESILGAARGIARMGDREIVTFRRGQVTFVDGRAVDAQLREEHEVRRAEFQQLLARSEGQSTQADQASERRAEGQQRRATLHRNPYFRQQPAVERLRVWNDLARRFPELDLQREIQAATVAAAREERINRARIARLQEQERIEQQRKVEEDEWMATNRRVAVRRVYRSPSQSFRLDRPPLRRAPVPEPVENPTFFSTGVTLPAGTQPIPEPSRSVNQPPPRP